MSLNVLNFLLFEYDFLNLYIFSFSLVQSGMQKAQRQECRIAGRWLPALWPRTASVTQMWAMFFSLAIGGKAIILNNIETD